MVFIVQKALPLTAAGGMVVLNGAIAGTKGLPGQSLYNASKAAVRSFARCWTTDRKKAGHPGQRGIAWRNRNAP